MDRSTLSLWADIVGLVTGAMTMLGIGGLLTWANVNKSRSELSRKVLSVAEYSIKFSLCLLAAILFVPIGYLLFVFPYLISTVILEDPGATTRLAWILFAVFFGPILVPVYIYTCMSIVQSSFAPLRQLWSRLTGVNRRATS